MNPSAVFEIFDKQPFVVSVSVNVVIFPIMKNSFTSPFSFTPFTKIRNNSLKGKNRKKNPALLSKSDDKDFNEILYFRTCNANFVFIKLFTCQPKCQIGRQKLEKKHTQCNENALVNDNQF